MSHLTKALRSSCVSLPLLITLLSSLVLISCGGGGGGSSGGGGNTDTSLTGSFYFVQNNSNLAIANVPYTLSHRYLHKLSDGFFQTVQLCRGVSIHDFQ